MNFAREGLGRTRIPGQGLVQSGGNGRDGPHWTTDSGPKIAHPAPGGRGHSSGSDTGAQGHPGTPVSQPQVSQSYSQPEWAGPPDSAQGRSPRAPGQCPVLAATLSPTSGGEPAAEFHPRSHGRGPIPGSGPHYPWRGSSGYLGAPTMLRAHSTRFYFPGAPR